MVPWECVRSGIPALCSNGCIQCRALEKINEEGDVYYHEKLEFILREKDHGIFPWEVSHNIQSQQEGNKIPGCKKELNWKCTKKVLQNPYTDHVTMFLQTVYSLHRNTWHNSNNTENNSVQSHIKSLVLINVDRLL